VTSKTPISDRLTHRSRKTQLAAQLTELGGSRAFIIAELARGLGLGPAEATRAADHAYDRLKAAGWPGRPKAPRAHGAHGRFVAAAPPSESPAAEEIPPAEAPAADTPPETPGGVVADALLSRLGAAWATMAPERRATILTALSSGTAEAATSGLSEVLAVPVSTLAETLAKGAGGIADLAGHVGRRWRVDQLGLLFDRDHRLDVHVQWVRRADAPPVPPVPEAPDAAR
jgi:hypothetical protein